MSRSVKSEEHAEYSPSGGDSLSNDDAIIQQALKILGRRIKTKRHGNYLTSPDSSKDYIKLKLAECQHEIFGVMFLTNRHQIIDFEEMFRGTIDGASVYPREVVKRVLELNAAAVILVHNHPSGNPEPSRADEQITHRLKESLSTIDVRVLDHLIVADDKIISFAERGMI
jgi:DNA repair protein RadC